MNLSVHPGYAYHCACSVRIVGHSEKAAKAQRSGEITPVKSGSRQTDLKTLLA